MTTNTGSRLNRLLEEITKARMINRQESRKHAILSNTVVFQTKSLSYSYPLLCQFLHLRSGSSVSITKRIVQVQFMSTSVSFFAINMQSPNKYNKLYRAYANYAHSLFPIFAITMLCPNGKYNQLHSTTAIYVLYCFTVLQLLCCAPTVNNK